MKEKKMEAVALSFRIPLRQMRKKESEKKMLVLSDLKYDSVKIKESCANMQEKKRQRKKCKNMLVIPFITPSREDKGKLIDK